jgi:hypothetical protein
MGTLIETRRVAVTATNLKWLWWAGVVVLILYDLVIGIPNRVATSILIVAIFWALGDLNKRLEKLELESVRRVDELTKRFDELNKRLRWVEFKFFGTDRDNMLSEEWSARHRAGEYEP